MIILETHVDDVRARLDSLRHLIGHTRWENNDEGRILVDRRGLLCVHFAHGNTVVAQHLGESARPISLLVPNTDGCVVVPSLGQDGRCDREQQREHDDDDHRACRGEALARRRSDDSDLFGFHDATSASRHARRRSGVKRRNAST